MPADRAFCTGPLNAVGSMIATAIPSAFAAMAVFIELTISATILLSEPVHWYEQLMSAHASWMPYCVGTKNGFVVTWLTKTKFHLGWLGKFPPPPDAVFVVVVVLLPHAARNAAPAEPAIAVCSKRRRLIGNREKYSENFVLSMYKPPLSENRVYSS